MIRNIENIEERPKELDGQTIVVKTACGNMYVTINSTDDYPIFEVLCASGKTGSCSAAFVDALTRTISIALRGGIKPEEIIKQIKSIRCPKSNSKDSCPEALAKAMEDYLDENYEEVVVEIEDIDESNIEDNYSYNYTVEGEDICNDVEPKYNETESNTNFVKCPECGEKKYNPADQGCGLCMACGYSKCK